MILTDKEKYDYRTFFVFFKRLLYQQNSCFERDIIRDNQDNLWQAWIVRERNRLVSLDVSVQEHNPIKQT